jgi:hypothetical protein
VPQALFPFFQAITQYEALSDFEFEKAA